MAQAKTPGEVMRAARERDKKTQAQIAAELGVTQPLIAKWEAGNGYVKTEDLRRVAHVYGVKPEQLIPDENAA